MRNIYKYFAVGMLVCLTVWALPGQAARLRMICPSDGKKPYFGVCPGGEEPVPADEATSDRRDESRPPVRATTSKRPQAKGGDCNASRRPGGGSADCPPKEVVTPAVETPRLSFEPEMVAIPAGSFKMGSPSNETGRSDAEGPVHTVHIDAFQMGKYEVTNAQFRKFRPEHNSGEYKGHSLNDDNQPVVNVSWADAVAYTEWLAKKTGKSYRLPTEAEWEYAARAGTTTRYYWGNDIDPTKLNFSDKNDPSGPARKDLDDGYAVSAPVGSYSSNSWGLYDMPGNKVPPTYLHDMATA